MPSAASVSSNARARVVGAVEAVVELAGDEDLVAVDARTRGRPRRRRPRSGTSRRCRCGGSRPRAPRSPPRRSRPAAIWKTPKPSCGIGVPSLSSIVGDVGHACLPVRVWHGSGRAALTRSLPRPRRGDSEASVLDRTERRGRRAVRDARDSCSSRWTSRSARAKTRPDGAGPHGRLTLLGLSGGSSRRTRGAGPAERSEPDSCRRLRPIPCGLVTTHVPRPETLTSGFLPRRARQAWRRGAGHPGGTLSSARRSPAAASRRSCPLAQVAVLGVPGARLEVGPAGRRSAPRRRARQQRPHRLRRADLGVEQRLGPAPERLEEAVLAVAGVGIRSTRVRPPSAASTSLDRREPRPLDLEPLARCSCCQAGSASSSNVKTTTGPRATRRSSARPAAGGSQWWIVTQAIAASNASSSNGSASARASIAGAAPGGRCARIVALGSTASTQRSAARRSRRRRRR